MNKRMLFLNGMFFVICMIISTIYLDYGKTWLKGVNSSCFVWMGIINLIYALKSKVQNKKMYVCMAVALSLCMAGDVVINVSFIPGAFLFAMGHVFYFSSYCMMHKYKVRDLFPTGLIFLSSAAVILFCPSLDFGTGLMKAVCLIYALIISFMVGKAVSDFARERNVVTLLLLVGSVLFMVSDTALVFNMFADGGRLTRILCLFTYYPANCLLAYTMFRSVEKREKKEPRIRAKIAQARAWVRRHPQVIFWLAVVTIAFYMQCIIVALSCAETEIFSVNSILGVLSTGAEVVAGLYGLTLTGYIFFLDSLQQKAENDDMLEDIVTLLKKRYHNMVLFLSVLCVAVIFTSFCFVSYNTESGLISELFYRLIGYEILLFTFITLFFNVYFVLKIVEPDKISRASLKYKEKLSKSGTEFGSLQEFLQDYEDIENLIREKSQDLAVDHIVSNPWRALKHLNGKERLEIGKIMSDPLLRKLTKVGQYYSYMLFSQEMTVTKEICDMAKEIKEELNRQ